MELQRKEIIVPMLSEKDYKTPIIHEGIILAAIPLGILIAEIYIKLKGL